MLVKERYYQNERPAAKGNWNGVHGILGEGEGIVDCRVQVIGIGVGFGIQVHSRKRWLEDAAVDAVYMP